MKRRTVLASLAGAALTAAPGILRGARRPAGDKPNLLFLWTDQQRADTMPVYGNDRYRVPAFNELGRSSVVFDRCYVTQPVCSPNRAAVMTGQWPHQTGIITNNIPLDRRTPALPELVADSSYHTAYMGKWHLGDELFPQHGFQEWVSIEDVYHRYFSEGRSQDERSSYHDFLVNLGYEPDSSSNRFSRAFAARLPVEHTKASFLANEASRFVLGNQNRPWMLYVNFLEPHTPFDGPLNDLHSESEAALPLNYPGIPIEREPERYQRQRERLIREGFGGVDLKTRAGWQRLSRNYAGLCSLVDQAIGRILWALEASGQADNTIIVHTTDHGEMMGSHSLLTKGVFYEEASRIPLLLRVPFRQNRLVRVEQPVSQIDIVPTLLELLGRKVPESLPGQSLVPALHGERLREDHVFIEWHTPPQGPNGRAVISPEGWKLGLYDTDNSLLFHRAKDPLEMHNLYYRPESSKVVSGLRTKLETWQRRVEDTLRLEKS